MSEFEPRPPEETLPEGVPWLARMTDKARAFARGNIGDYTYPCPADQGLLADLGLTASEFLEIATTADDHQVVERVRRLQAENGRKCRLQL